MRITLSIALMTLGAGALQAQETEPLQILPDTRTEIGVFGQTMSNSGGESMGLLGINYKKMISERKGFRIIAAYSGYDEFRRPFAVASSGDTVTERYTRTNINLAVLGGGVEMQRHFYKRIYLFAAMEVRGGYGKGDQDTLQQRISGTGMPFMPETRAGSSNASMLYVGFMPSIGAKLQFKKLTLGLEFSGVDLSFKQIKIDNDPSNGTSNMQMGTFTHRVFLNYKL